MKKEEVDFSTFSTGPGVYLFRDAKKRVLYAGRATDLRSRVRSYFSGRLGADRGPRLLEAVEKTTHIETIPTDSVLDAYILEANTIKKYDPPYNVADRDNKSFQYVGITDEPFPRVLIVRGRELELGISKHTFKHLYGPFPKGSLLREALKVLRKILPYRDTCKPYAKTSRSRKKCFRAELGLCPGVCSGDMGEVAYMKRIREIRLFFEGKKKQLVRLLEGDMKKLAREKRFEEAQEVRDRIFSLTHIQDVALIKYDAHTTGTVGFRIEAFDVAHTVGKDTVGVMVVYVDGEKDHKEYRTFGIRSAKKADDIAALKEMLQRRFQHPEWKFPNLLVVDGGRTHLKAAQSVMDESGISIPLVAVVKNEKHIAREILGLGTHKKVYEREIILANQEAHRFALSQHKKKRTKSLLGK